MIDLTRDLKQYRDVEKFYEYELTSCMAYEMAIRNSNVIDIIKNQIKSIDDPFMLEQYFFVPIELPNIYLEYHFFRGNELNNFTKVKHEISRRIMFKRFDRVYRGFKIENEVERFELNDNDALDGFSKPCIFQEFSRPLLKAPPKIDKTIDICNLNISLPKHELIAYITTIKTQYDESHGIVKTPFENVFGEFNESNLDRKHGFSALDWADALFIYDYWKLYRKEKLKGDIISDIKIELSHYHRQCGSSWRKGKDPLRDDYVNEKTTSNYLNMMIDYIDNLHYKELLTGISS